MTGAIIRDVTVGGVRMILGDCLQVMAEADLGHVDHVIGDPPYEDDLHAIKSKSDDHVRTDGGSLGRPLGFDGISAIRAEVVAKCQAISNGWFIAFCTAEGVGRWADVINASAMRYKRACIWIKPDATPQMNGQGPAQGAEAFVTAWCARGVSKWNGGGKRGVYTEMTNPRDRHGLHPTEKPWRLMRDIILDFTNPNQTILDPFAGTGTTAVACVLTGRKAVCIEVNPDFFDAMVLRVRKADAHARALGVQAKPQIQEVMF